MDKKNTVTIVLQTVLFSIATIVAMAAKVSFMVGSERALFSLSSALLPLSGMLGGWFCLFGTFLCRAMTISLLSSAGVLVNLLPNFIAGLYATVNSRLFRVLVPLICMILFVIHPVGRYAAPYALYWLIPILYALSKTRFLFLHMFATTFTAHAVGSVIWIYSVSMTAAQWYALIPVVFVERMLFASAMVVCYYLFGFVFGIIKSFVTAFSPKHKAAVSGSRG